MKPVKKALSFLIIGFTLGFVLFLGLFVVPYFANIVMPWNKTEAIETALSWGGLANIPNSALNIIVDTEGSMFTREFIIEFNCECDDIEEWISQSPGLKNINPAIEDHGILIYQVPGKEGAIGGIVTIDKNKGKVTIDMSWS
jgi:hypothetical protein